MTHIVLLGQRVKGKVFGPIKVGPKHVVWAAQNLFLVRYVDWLWILFICIFFTLIQIKTSAATLTVTDRRPPSELSKKLAFEIKDSLHRKNFAKLHLADESVVFHRLEFPTNPLNQNLKNSWIAPSRPSSFSGTQSSTADSLRPKFRVLHASLEAHNASVGGIGSYLSGLLRAELQTTDSQGHPIIEGSLITPFYDFLKAQFLEEVQFRGLIDHEVDGRIYQSSVYELVHMGIRQYLIQPDPNYHNIVADIEYRGGELFDVIRAEHLYSIGNRGMIYFQSAVATAAALYRGASGRENIDVLQLNTGRFFLSLALLSLELNQKRSAANLPPISTVTTTHDTSELKVLESSDAFQRVGLDRPLRPQISPNAISNIFSNVSSVVSKSLVDDISSIQSETDLGLGHLYNSLRKINRLVGINNGVELERFDPTERAILGDLAVDLDYKNLQQRKHQAKAALFRENIIGSETKPLFLYVGRLAREKGIDVLGAFARYIIQERGGQVVILGSSPGVVPTEVYHWLSMQTDPRFNGMFKLFMNRQKDQEEVLTTTHAKKGNLLRFAADFTIVPSIIEGCGLVPIEAFSMGSGVITSNVQGLKSVCRRPLDETGIDGKLGHIGNFTCIAFKREPQNLQVTFQNLFNRLDDALRQWNRLNPEEQNQLQITWIKEAKTFAWNISTEPSGYQDLYSLALKETSEEEKRIRKHLLELYSDR